MYMYMQWCAIRGMTAARCVYKVQPIHNGVKDAEFRLLNQAGQHTCKILR